MIETLLEMPASEALGWALLHSLWQATIAAALVAPVRSASARYMAGCGALVAALSVFLFTFWQCLPHTQPVAGVTRAAALALSFGVEADTLAAAASRNGNIAAYLTPFWFAGVVFFQARIIAAWIMAQRLRRRGVCLVPEEWRPRLRGLAVRMGVEQPVQILESALATMPMVVGYLRPAILVPAGLLSAMPPHHIEAILLHELAHIRRHDYLVNLLQTVVEGLLFYNPAIWWISNVIRTEREHCCDDAAVAAAGSGGAYEYARALTALEACRSTRGLEPAAGVAATGGNLMKRIRRLLYPQNQRRTATAGWAAAPALATIVLMMTAASQGPAAPQQDTQNSPYRKWVNEDVVYIIEPGEREEYLRLQTDSDRHSFIQQFWQRRDPTPGTANNEFKEEHYRRSAYANKRFLSATKAGWNTDRGRIYIVYGPPDEIESHPSGRDGGPPFEQWLYNFVQGIGNSVIIEFSDVNRDGEYRQTRDPHARN